MGAALPGSKTAVAADAGAAPSLAWPQGPFLANVPIKNALLFFCLFFFLLSISFSQVMQYPPNTVLEQDLQRVTSNYNSCSVVGCSLPGYLIY